MHGIIHFRRHGLVKIMHGSEQRTFGRVELAVSGYITVGGSVPMSCKSRNISYRGALIITEAVSRIGAKAVLALSDMGVLGCRVVRVLQDGLAVEFDRKLSSKEMLCILGKHCDATLSH